MHKSRSMMFRGACAVLLAVVMLPVGGGVAAAHGGGLGPASSLPRIVALDPPVPGLDVTVIEAGARLRIDNHVAVTVEVVPPPGAVRRLEPIVAPGETARWADTRITALAEGARPAEGHQDWAVPLQVGEQTVLVRGEQVWPPPPPAGLWWLATALTAAAVTAVGALAVNRRRVAAAFAAVTLTVVGAHLTHILGSALVPEGQSYAGVALGAAGAAIVAWPVGMVGAAMTVAGRSYGHLLCALSGALLALFTAFDAVGFSNAVLPFGWSPDLDRATTVLTFGGGLGLFVTGFLVLRQLDPTVPPDAQIEGTP